MSWGFEIVGRDKNSMLQKIEEQHERSKSVGHVPFAHFPRACADAVHAAVAAFPGGVNQHLHLRTHGHVDSSGAGNMLIEVRTLPMGTVLESPSSADAVPGPAEPVPV